MKLVVFTLTALTLALGLTLSSVGEARQADAPREGNESHGGGTEKPPSTGFAWFLGRDNVIKTCVLVVPEFRMFRIYDRFGKGESYVPSQSEAESYVRDSFAKWATYLSQRGLQRENAWGYSEGFGGYATKLEFQPACDSSTDLRVYFGGSDAFVDHVRQSYKNPYGIAGTTDAGANLLWRKGLIWLANTGSVDSSTPQWAAKNVSAILTHEIGHAFGSGHVPGTIMREDLGQIMEYGELPDYIDHIDQERTLYRGDETHRLVLHADMEHFQYRLGFFLERVFGHKADGQIVETLEVSQPRRSLTETGTLTVTDGKTTKILNVNLRFPMGCSRIGEGIFWNAKSNFGDGAGTNSTSCILIGTLSDGKHVIPVTASRDGDYRYQITMSDVEDIFKNEVFVWEQDTPGSEDSVK